LYRKYTLFFQKKQEKRLRSRELSGEVFKVFIQTQDNTRKHKSSQTV